MTIKLTRPDKSRRFFHAITPPDPVRTAGPSPVFQDKTTAALKAWQRTFERQFRRALGWKLKAVPLRAKRISREVLTECVREKWIFLNGSTVGCNILEKIKRQIQGM